MKTTTITLNNDFHGTSVNLRANGDRLSAGQVAKARRTLCGVAGCRCSGKTGMRGAHDFELVENCEGSFTVCAFAGSAN
jgi:hypothetical protein